MKEGAIRDRGLDAMANGVAEVKEGSRSGGFLFIFFDHAGFDGDVAGDQFGGNRLNQRIERFEVGKHRFIANGGVFDDFGEAFPEFATRKGEEGLRVDEDQPGLVKSANEVFPLGCIDTGFPSDSRVDLRDDGGGDLDEGDAAIENGGDKARKISGNTPAKGHDE